MTIDCTTLAIISKTFEFPQKSSFCYYNVMARLYTILNNIMEMYDIDLLSALNRDMNFKYSSVFKLYDP